MMVGCVDGREGQVVLTDLQTWMLDSSCLATFPFVSREYFD